MRPFLTCREPACAKLEYQLAIAERVAQPFCPPPYAAVRTVDHLAAWAPCCHVGRAWTEPPEHVLAECPYLEHQDVLAAVDYAAETLPNRIP
jgi:hypothetical protein